MINAISLSDISENVREKGKNGRLVGVLFANPNSSLSKQEIIGHLDEFHYYSEKNIDFYCAGYGAWLPPSPEIKTVTKVGDIPWVFDNKKFVELIKDFEKNTSWKYSGEVELILLDTDLSNPNGLNFSSTIVCNLEEMIKAGTFSSVRNFFYKLFNNTELTAWHISDKLGIEVGKRNLLGLFLETFKLKSLYDQERSLVIRDISK